jgi:hypothetical protein
MCRNRGLGRSDCFWAPRAAPLILGREMIKPTIIGWQATIARAWPEGPVRAIGTRLQSYFYARIGPIHAAGRAPSSEDKSMAPIPRAGEHCSAVGE